MTDHRHLADSPGLLLWRATLQWQRRIVAALKPLASPMFSSCFCWQACGG